MPLRGVYGVPGVAGLHLVLGVAGWEVITISHFYALMDMITAIIRYAVPIVCIYKTMKWIAYDVRNLGNPGESSTLWMILLLVTSAVFWG